MSNYKGTEELTDRRFCTICGSRKMVKNMCKVWVGLAKKYYWYCPSCLDSAMSQNFLVRDRGVKMNMPLYNDYDSIFTA